MQKEEGRRKKEEGRRKKEEGRKGLVRVCVWKVFLLFVGDSYTGDSYTGEMGM
ncbi:MAG: hypothetical protein F6K18_17710 [Okeania sp. SIO2C2]|uniref:hypothetical protein n=1 Tax=Okeania sp. SIO2C2 TaxID=2607787 RepID=UPI0013BC3A17|nr:hypothetical protein [Okeania sp. SIO2C2]NEP88518.1 hypothetical protein [Okeania sp. SIO2C2]